MRATDELRRMLDERGVEWQDEGYPTTNTVWVADGIVWRGLFRDGCIELVAQLTPEQAVEATLGSDLKAENAKLRELVRELANDPDAWDYDYFKWRLRELGVEV